LPQSTEEDRTVTRFLRASRIMRRVIARKFPSISVSVISTEAGMVKTALFVRLEAKPGKEQEVESFLTGGLRLVEQEPATIAWFGLKIAPSVYGIFDAFPDDAGRQAHLLGKVAEALMARAPDLFANAPEILSIDVLAAKLPS
jgi:quinol monooxygenase YgiN